MGAFTRLRGIWPALATPLNADETLDEAGMRRLLHRVLDGGVHGVVVLGSAGEFAPLADPVKRRAIELVVTEVAGHVPVMAGTGEPGTRRAVATTRQAAKLGADAAMVVPPYYYGQNPAQIITHYRALVAEAQLPVVLYNIPGCTKVTLGLDVVDALKDEPGIVGIKDSGGNFGHYQNLVESAKSDTFGVVTGSDTLLFPSLLVGGDGSIGPGANIAPQWFVGLWDAVQNGRLDDAQAYQHKIRSLTAIYRVGGFHPGLKAALSALGVCRPTVTSPMAALDAAQMQVVAAKLASLGLL